MKLGKLVTGRVRDRVGFRVIDRVGFRVLDRVLDRVMVPFMGRVIERVPEAVKRQRKELA